MRTDALSQPVENPGTMLGRRDFLTRSALAAVALGGMGSSLSLFGAGDSWPPAMAVFSKVYQEVKLDFDQAAALTQEAGLDGVDCPVRPKGEIEPERAADDMPRYAEALKQHNAAMLLLTTGITSVDFPHTETVLRTGKKLGIRYYRLGQYRPEKGKTMRDLIPEVRARFKDLAALNRQLGMTAIFQNHSPSGNSAYLGGDLTDMAALVEGFAPDEIAVAFDLGHALVVHQDEWKTHFEKLKSHLGIAYIKDADRVKRFVAFGEGEFSRTDYFQKLKAMDYRRPFSVHIEYEWTPKGQPKTREALLRVLKESRQAVNKWCGVS